MYVQYIYAKQGTKYCCIIYKKYKYVHYFQIGNLLWYSQIKYLLNYRFIKILQLWISLEI